MIGVSLDSADAHDEFRARVWSRASRSSPDAGGALTTSSTCSRTTASTGCLPRRVTFLLDADGIVQQVWDVTDAGAHPDEVLAAVTG